MKIVHTMIRVNDLDESLKFYCDGLGMKLLKRKDFESGRFTNVFVGYGAEETDAVIELTYNWDTHKYDLGNGFGHIALGVPDVYKACEEFRAKGVKIVREPGPMKHGTGSNAIAFLEDPNGYKIELTTRPYSWKLRCRACQRSFRNRQSSPQPASRRKLSKSLSVG